MIITICYVRKWIQITSFNFNSTWATLFDIVSKSIFIEDTVFLTCIWNSFKSVKPNNISVVQNDLMIII